MADKYKFIDLLDELIELLETMTTHLMKNEMDKYEENISGLSRLLKMCFPQIIISYSDPALRSVAEDATYWSGQLGRIIETISADDKFAKIDVLYQETRVNLISYREMIKDTAICEELIEETE